MMKMLFRVSYFPIQRVHLLSVEWFKMWVIVSIVISLGKLHLKPLCLKCSFIVGKLTRNVFFMCVKHSYREQAYGQLRGNDCQPTKLKLEQDQAVLSEYYSSLTRL